MKKIALLLVLVMVISVPLNVSAVTPRVTEVIPGISFAGTTATCSVNCYGDTVYDYIVLTIKLWHGSEILHTWTATGNGVVSFSRTVTVESGEAYKLAVEVMINGSLKPSASCTGACP